MKTRTIDTFWLLLFISIAVLATSCTGSRKAIKNESKVTQQSTVSSETKTKVEDKTKTVITETTADTVIIPGLKIQSESIGTTTSVIIDQDTLKAVYNPLTNTTTATYTSKPKPIIVAKEKRTEIISDVKTDVVVKADSTGKKTVKEKAKDVTQKTSWLWLWIIIGIILAGVAYYLYKRFL